MDQQNQSYPRNSKEYYLANKERIRAQQKAYREANKAKIYEKQKEWVSKNKDVRAKHRATRLLTKPEIVRAEKAAYKQRCRKQMPSWASIKAIKEIYVLANKLGKTVDHIIPLKGKTVCGLHVEYNLQILSRKENSSKGNSYQGDNH